MCFSRIPGREGQKQKQNYHSISVSVRQFTSLYGKVTDKTERGQSGCNPNAAFLEGLSCFSNLHNPNTSTLAFNECDVSSVVICQQMKVGGEHLVDPMQPREEFIMTMPQNLSGSDGIVGSVILLMSCSLGCRLGCILHSLSLCSQCRFHPNPESNTERDIFIILPTH